MKCLLTGGAGFVGSHLARALLDQGVELHGVGTEPTHGGLPLESWHVADVRELEGVRRAVAAVKPDLVLHLAGQSSAARSFERPLETFHANALGTWNVLESVRREAPRARALVIGSGEVYGPQPEGTRTAEAAPFRPVSPYALSKAAADLLAELAASIHGVDAVRTRSFSHTGPGQAPTFIVPSVAQQLAAIEQGRSEPVLKVGNLDVTRDLSDVRDVVRAYVALLERGRAGAVYNVCRGEGVRLTEVIDRLVRRARVPIRVEVDPSRYRPADVPYLVGDRGAIERDTGWQPEIPLDRTLDDCVEEWRARTAPVA